MISHTSIDDAKPHLRGTAQPASRAGNPQATVHHFLGWDVVNWANCLSLWDPHVSGGRLTCLEVGCGPGGLSLWLASKGHRVTCSDRSGVSRVARELHRRHGLSDSIDYEAIDATLIPHIESVDIVLCKSVLGGIWAQCGLDACKLALEQMHKALKPNGKLLFAENLRATVVHMFCRSRFLGRGPTEWQYPTIRQMMEFLAPFSSVEYRAFGLFGAFGRTEAQRTILAYADRLVEPMVPERFRYIIAGVATK
jgi:SAM-dependent methyltransferase